MSAKYRLEGVLPSLTQPCLASVQPANAATRCTECCIADQDGLPAPSDAPATTVSDHFGAAAGSRNCDQPSPG